MKLYCDPPPSTNVLFANAKGKGKGRVKTRAYKAWLTAAGLQINTQRPVAVLGKVDVRLAVPRNNRRDLDNHLKPVLDLLVKLGIVEDDRRVEKITLNWHDDKLVEIQLAEVGA